MDNIRGISLTNILRNVYEKELDSMTTEKVKINGQLCGGKKVVEP